MKTSDQAVRTRLLEAARQEFLGHGYEKASLRKISAKAGVTTGAVYFFFQSKALLFEEVVEPTVKQLGILAADMISHELENPDIGVENERRILAFLWKNREVFLILFEKAAGTKYEDFAEEMARRLESSFALFFQKYGPGEPDRELIRILVRMKMEGYRSLIAGEYDFERTLELADMIGQYTEGGFESLMKELNRRSGM